MIHIAGSVVRGGFTYDTHAHATPDAVFALLERAVARCGAVPIILERDHGFDWNALAEEMERARAAAAGAVRGESSRAAAAVLANHDHHEANSSPLRDAEGGELARAQAAFARALAGLEDDARFDALGIARAREILSRKRIEEALPLLPRVGSDPRATAIARALIARCPGAARRAALADARAIAAAVESIDDAALSDAAKLDGLALDARLSFDEEGASPRRAPWVGSVSLARGRCYAFKGPGAGAGVHFFHRHT
jgi:hypothetical protein